MQQKLRHDEAVREARSPRDKALRFKSAPRKPDSSTGATNRPWNVISGTYSARDGGQRTWWSTLPDITTSFLLELRVAGNWKRLYIFSLLRRSCPLLWLFGKSGRVKICVRLTKFFAEVENRSVNERRSPGFSSLSIITFNVRALEIFSKASLVREETMRVMKCVVK